MAKKNNAQKAVAKALKDDGKVSKSEYKAIVSSGVKPAAITSQAASQGGRVGTQAQALASGGTFSAAGVNGNISKNEALKIAENKGISTAQVMDRALDKGLTIGASLVNQYNSGKLDDRSYVQKATDNVFLGMGGKSQYQPQSLNKLNTFGQMSKGSVYGGMTSTGTPVLDMKIPSNVVRTGSTTPFNPGATTGGDPTNSSGDPTVTGTEEVVTPEKIEEEPIKPIFQSANGDNLSGNASGFRVAKSSWKKSGKNMAGTNSLKIKPTGLASGVGLSVSGRM
jgi:hypothetical protein